MAGKLPKVTEYIKNVGKSLGYAAIDAIKEPTENVSEFIENNEDLFKVIYSATKNYRQTIKMVDTSIRSSNIYKDVDIGLKNLKDDLRTGKFYNKERDDKTSMDYMGEDFADFSDMEDSDAHFDEDDDDLVDRPQTSETRAAAISIQSTISGTVNAQTRLIGRGTDLILNSNRASTKLMYAQNSKIFGTLVSGFSGLNNGMQTISSVLNGPMITYMNESTKFYNTVSTSLNEQTAYLKEIAEMQRNLYKQTQEPYKTSKYENVVSGGGVPDIKNYAKQIAKNIKELDPTGGMLSFGDADGGDILKMYIGSPLKFITGYMMKFIIPTTVRKTLQTFDEGMSGVFSSFITRMNKWGKGDEGDSSIKEWIGKILGINIDRKTNIDTSKYTRGPIPFDGETKKSIVEVIPAYLASIESALTGMPERNYDGTTGKWKTAKQISREYNDIKKNSIRSGTQGIEESFNRWATNEANGDRDKYNELKASFKRMSAKIYENGGDFRPYMGYGPKGERNLEGEAYSEYGFSDRATFDSAIAYLRKHNKKGLYGLSKETIRAQESLSSRLRGAETGYSPYNMLYNDRLQEIDPKKGTLRGYSPNRYSSSGLAYEANPKFKTATGYLKDILLEVRYIRTHGANGGGGKPYSYKSNKRSKNTPEDFNEWIKSQGVETIQEEAEYIPKEYFGKPEEPKKLTDAERFKKSFSDKFKEAESIPEKWKVMRKGVEDLLKSPTKWITKIINKADERIFTAIFGDENGETYVDKRGRSARGLLDYMIMRSEDAFDKMNDYIKKSASAVWEKFKSTSIGSKVADFGSNLKDSLKDKFGQIGSRVKGAFGRTYGVPYNALKNNIINAQEIEGSRRSQIEEDGMYTDQILDWNDVQNSAYGRMVDKYGLTMVSPGELIIPNAGSKTKKRNLIEEKREKKRIINAIKSGNIAHNANGNVASASGNKTEEDKTQDAIHKVMREVSGDGADIAANALIGSGVSLITGLFGGPLLGAAAGAGIGLIKNSEFLQRTLFGSVAEDGKHKGGLVGKNIIEFFTKNGKDMLDFGIAGGITGLITPFGPVGGAIIGATLGYAKNNQKIQEFLFGSEITKKRGIIDKDLREHLHDAVPNMAVGAAAGLLVGPFGFVGNLLVGSTLGYVSSTEKFKEILFGTEGADGKRKGGLAGIFKEGLIDPLIKGGKNIYEDLKDYASKWIIGPTKDFMKPVGTMIINTISNVGNRVSDGINGIFERTLGIPLKDFLQKWVFKPLTKITGFITKIPINIGKAIVAAPFQLFKSIGDSIMTSQIGKGSARFTSAKERLEFRDKHKVRFGMMNLRNRDKTRVSDELLANADEDTLNTLSSLTEDVVDQRGKYRNLYNDDKRKYGESISKYIRDPKSKTGFKGDLRYGGKNGQKQIMKLLDAGDKAGLETLLKKNGIDPADFYKKTGVDMGDLEKKRMRMSGQENLTDDALRQLRQLTGDDSLNAGKAGMRGLRNYRAMLKSEINARDMEKADKEASNEPPTEAEVKQDSFRTSINENFKAAIDILTTLNNNIAKTVPGGNGDELDTVMAAGTAGLSGNGVKVKRGKGRVTHITSKITDSGKVMTLKDGKPADDKDTHEAIAEVEEEKKMDEENKSNIAITSLTLKGFVDHLFGKDSESEKKPSLFSRPLNTTKSVGGGIMHFLGMGGPVLKALGPGAVTIGGISLMGHASQFLKEKVTPWFSEHVKPFFSKVFNSIATSEPIMFIRNKIGELVTGFKDGSLIRSGINWLIQGFQYSIKNVMVPLTAAIVRSFPDIVCGIVKGLYLGGKDLLKGDTKYSESSFSTRLKNTASSFSSGKDESKIISDNFSGGSSWSSSLSGGVSSSAFPSSPTHTPNTTPNAAYIPGTDTKVSYQDDPEYGRIYSRSSDNMNQYSAPGEYTNANGSTSTVDENGHVTTYDKKGNSLGSYYQESGDIDETAMTVGTKSGFLPMAGNSLLRSLATGKTPLILKGMKKLSEKIPWKSVGKSFRKTMTSGLLGKAGHLFAGVGKLAAKGVSTIGTAASTAGSAINNALRSGMALPEVGTKLSKAIDPIATSLSKNGGFMASLGEKIIHFFEWLSGSSVVNHVFGFLKSAVTGVADSGPLVKGFKSLGTKFASLISSGGAKAATGKAFTKVLGAVGNMSPLAIAMWIKAISDGVYFKTETILGVSKDSGYVISMGMRVIVGIVNAINENLLLGLIDTGKVLDVVLDIFGPLVGYDDTKLEEAQEYTKNIITDASIAAGEDITLARYNGQEGMLKGFNNWLNRTAKPMKPITKAKDQPKRKANYALDYNPITGELDGAGRGRYGRGHAYQRSGMYANVPYGDSTIGQSGCAPVAAANVLSKYGKGKDSVMSAAQYADNNGYTVPGGGTDINYFDDYFSRNGIDSQQTSSRSSIMKALKHGNQVVMLGRDKPGMKSSPFSNSDHFITATGMDSRGNMTVEDPDLPQSSTTYRASDVMKSMHSSVIAGGKRNGRKRYGRARTLEAQDILNIAKNEVSDVSKETPNGSNKTKYGKAFGLDGEPWCAIFVWWVFKEAGAEDLLPIKTGSCTELLKAFNKAGQQVSEPVPGDLVFFNFNGGSNPMHIGIVEKATADTIYTFEGNTSAANATNGAYVQNRTRNRQNAIAFARPAYANATFDDVVAGDPSNGLFSKLAKLGKLMVKHTFGESAYNALFGDEAGSESGSTAVESSDNSNAEAKLWKHLRDKGYSKEGTAGIMGNLKAESGMISSNVQNGTYNSSLGLMAEDEEYTKKVNSGSIDEKTFSSDKRGYGLAQWTASNRKQDLYNRTKKAGSDVSSLDSQMKFLTDELVSYRLSDWLKKANTVKYASDTVLTKFERPADQSASVQKYRTGLGEEIYNRHKGEGRSDGGYAQHMNEKYSNYSGGAREETKNKATTVSSNTYELFLQTIVQILMSISTNTEALNQILEIMSSKFGIDVDTKAIAASTKKSAKQTQQALNNLIKNNSDTSSISDILQKKDTTYIINAMTALARE